MLKNIISTKSRLCFSADFKKKRDLIKWIHMIGEHICVLKTHIDILEDFDTTLIKELNILKKKYNFLILEDRKFSDIGKTFRNQLDGIYRISEFADIITVHGISADGMLSQLNKTDPKVLLVAQMSCSGNIIDTTYTNNCYKIACKHREKVIGFICQEKFVEDSDFLYITPGVNIKKGNIKDQVYRTPDEVYRKGIDAIIVGSGIYMDSNPLETVLKYK